jgi:hypothetical protein
MSIRMIPTNDRFRHVVRRIVVGMVVKVSVGVGAVVAGAYGWVLMASLIFCFGVHHRELLEFPYTQWAEAASLFHTVNWPVKMWIITAAVPPSAVVLIALTTLVRFSRPLKRPLYGASEWADLGQMQAGGVQTRHKPSDF